MGDIVQFRPRPNYAVPCDECGATGSCTHKVALYNKRYRATHKVKRPLPETAAATTRRWLARQRAKAIERLGGVCVSCGFRDTRALQVDHIYNDGAVERKSLSRTQYRALLADADPTRHQLLCANCNCIKQVEWQRRAA